MHFLFKVQMSKNELSLLAGEYVLGYYSTNMQTLIAFSPTFQVSFHKLVHISLLVFGNSSLFICFVWIQILESQQAVMEGLVPENINGHEK